MEKVKWKVGGNGQVARKVPYTPKQRVKDEMSDDEKRGAERWNLMIDVLKENGLMEDK